MTAPKADLVFSGFPGWSLGEDSMFVPEKGIFLGRQQQFGSEHLVLCKFSPDSVVAFPGQTEASGGQLWEIHNAEQVCGLVLPRL